MTSEITRASEIGAQHGKNAASWVFDGSTDESTYRRYLQGIEDCGPEIMDALPSHGLSGEMADDYSARDLERDLGINPDDETEDFGDVCDAYEAAYNSTVKAEVARIAREHLAA
jgi:hypothetical protein